MSNGNAQLTDGERLIRIEYILEQQVLPALSKVVTQDQCTARHPAKPPAVARLLQWGQLALMVGALVAGGLALGGLEARIERVASASTKVEAVPVKTPPR